ncbi:hypothetical protein J504_1675 [Acinetobacter baumannii 348935]|nr:hypothetical protein J504_1675 [Acinetobacter baumannii 348935]
MPLSQSFISFLLKLNTEDGFATFMQFYVVKMGYEQKR